jgi:hypothetical protein
MSKGNMCTCLSEYRNGDFAETPAMATVVTSVLQANMIQLEITTRVKELVQLIETKMLSSYPFHPSFPGSKASQLESEE